MVLSSQSIERLCRKEYPLGVSQVPLLTPFIEQEVTHGMTAGLSSAGYDLRIDQDVKLYPASFKNLLLKQCGFRRLSFSLASTVEKFVMPKYLLAMVCDKSTWARRGLAVQNTLIEPGWSGHLTLELSNHGDQTLTIKKGCPIAQVIFFVLDHPTDKPYSGKYSHQARGPQPAILV
jgi:dCTP deaminase